MEKDRVERAFLPSSPLTAKPSLLPLTQGAADFILQPMTGVTDLILPDAAFDEQLREVLQSRVEFIALIGEDLVSAGGKRTRPLITLLSAQALGLSAKDSAWPRVMELAACVELLHSASLLHDDLIDNSETRRGQQTAFKRFGNVVSVMSGDFMLARLLMLLAQMPNNAALTRTFGETASLICEGEVLQFQVAAYGDYTLENYWQVIHGKTAALLELAASSPALLFGSPPHIREALATFGREYGMAFQIQDDLLDLMSDEATLGKPVGSDLHEGKATYPVLLLLETAQGEEVRQILERSAGAAGDVARVRELAKQYEVSRKTREEIRRRADLAVEALAALPASPAKTALTELARKELERKH
ncbi:All-trans-nonaprenyl-diphosphate synthase (geranyl-diphosphate specific) [Deinococcus xinjiangensis]|uniref:All-trans-nonaprenyl-diphosphate synthase (Geranyl-diphosphate specific) n=2 Tax=Deinococcus xinjiangensis TaxID=457454 RepID=A0ABP9VG13_9DEIO